MDYRRDEKLREIKRLRFDDDEFPPECARLVRFLGVQKVRDPNFRSHQADLCKYLYGVKGDNYELKASHLRELNGLMPETRKQLKLAYARPQSKLSAFRIDLPPGRKGQGISVEFIRRKSRRISAPPKDTPQTDGNDAVLLWKQTIETSGSHTIFLIYDTPEVGLPDRSLDRRGLWSGSGNVAAAFFIAEALRHVRQQVRVRRWRDIEHSEIVGKGECLIMLGNTFNPWLTRLRNREGWRGYQTFAFEPSISSFSRGVVRDMRPAARAEGQLPYEHKEELDGEAGTDFALISFFEDHEYNQLLCGVMGVTDAGSRAAAWFISRHDHIVELEHFLQIHLGRSLRAPRRSLEVLLQLSVEDGVHVDITIVDAVVYDD